MPRHLSPTKIPAPLPCWRRPRVLAGSFCGKLLPASGCTIPDNGLGGFFIYLTGLPLLDHRSPFQNLICLVLRGGYLGRTHFALGHHHHRQWLRATLLTPTMAGLLIPEPRRRSSCPFEATARTAPLRQGRR